MPAYTAQKIAEMTLLQRKALYENCLRKGGEEAAAIVALIESTGLPYTKEETVKDGDLIFRAMELVINSKDGEAAMLSMVNRGIPPLAGVDPLIAAELGAKYGKHNESTIQAGFLVARRMEALGLRKGTQRTLPRGCVALSGTMFYYPPDSAAQ
jgi:hypothetical protein